MRGDDGVDGGRWAHLAQVIVDLADGRHVGDVDRDLLGDARLCLDRDRFVRPRPDIDLADLAESDPSSSFSLFTRLLEVGTVDQATVRFVTLQAVYDLTRRQLYALLIAGYLRVAIQRRTDPVLSATHLLFRLPHVLHILCTGRRHASLTAPAPDFVPRAGDRHDLLRALRDLAPFPSLIQSEIPSTTTTWFAAFVEALAQLGLVAFPETVTEPPTVTEHTITDQTAAWLHDMLPGAELSTPVFRAASPPVDDDLFGLNWTGLSSLSEPAAASPFPPPSQASVTEPVLVTPTVPSAPKMPSIAPLLSSLSVADITLPEITLPIPSHVAPSITLPPIIERGEPITCSAVTEITDLVRRLAESNTGAVLTTDLVPELLDLALVQPAWFGRAQHAVATVLVPRLVKVDFQLHRPTLNACLARLATPSALQVIAVHGQLQVVLSALVSYWNAVVLHPMPPNEDPKTYSDVLARAQFILLFAMSEYGITNPELVEFRTTVLCIQPGTSGHDENKEISTALLSVSVHTHPEAYTYGDAMRLSALKYPPLSVLRAIRFGLLPSINQKVPDAERYYNFLRVLIVSLPFVSTVVVEFLSLALQADLPVTKSLSSHAVTWSRVFQAVLRFQCSLPIHMYRFKLAVLLAGAGPAVEADFASLLGPGHLSSIIRCADHRQLLLKHGKYLAKSHQVNQAASWKDIDVHLPLFRFCLEKGAGIYEFLDTLINGLREDNQSTRIPELPMFEMCAAILSMCGERIVPRNLRYDKYPFVAFLALVLTDQLVDEYDAAWSSIVTEATGRKTPGVLGTIASLLSCCPIPVPLQTASRWAQLQSTRGDESTSFLALSPSIPEHRALVRKMLREHELHKLMECHDEDDVDMDVLIREFKGVLAGR